MADNVAQIVIEATDKTHAAFGSINRAADYLQSRFAALSGLLGVGMFAKFMADSLESADKMGKMAQSVGVSTEALSRLSISAKLSDVDMESLAKSMGRLSKNTIEAAAGQGTAIAAFNFLGIKIKDANGHLKSNDQIMAEVADKFSGLADGAGKTALAMAIFGKSGAALIPMLNGGSEKMKEMSDLSDRLGLTLSKSTANGAEEVRDRFIVMGMAMKGISNNVMKDMLPTFDNLSKVMVDAATDTKLMQSAADGLSAALKTLVTGGVIVKSVFSAIGNIAAGTFAAIGFAAEGSFSKAAGVLKDMGNTMVDNTGDDMGLIAKIWDSAAPKIADAAKRTGKASADGYSSAIASGLEKDKLQNRLDSMFKNLNDEAFKKQMESMGANAAQILISQMAIAGASYKTLMAAMPMVDRYTAALAAQEAIKAQEAATKAIASASIATQDYNSQVAFEMSLIGKNTIQVQRLTEARKIELQLEKDLLALSKESAFKDRDKNSGVAEAYKIAVEAEIRKYEAAKKALDGSINEARVLSGFKMANPYATEQADYQERLDMAAAYHEKFSSDQEGFNRMTEQIETEHQDHLVQIGIAGGLSQNQFAELTLKSRARIEISMAQSMIGSAAQNSRAMFNLSKALALAQAAIDFPRSVMKAYAGGLEISGGMPWVGAAFAALAGSAQLINMNAIRSAEFGGGESGVAASAGGVSAVAIPGQAASPNIIAAPPPPSVQPVTSAPQKVTNITLKGSDVFTAQNVRDQLAPLLKDAIGDGVINLVLV